MKKKVVLFVNGAGGHATEMKSLLNYLSTDLGNYKYDALINLGSPVDSSLCHFNFYLPDIRHKNSNFITLLSALPIFIYTLLLLCFLFFKYNVVSVISTGPGVCIIPSLFFKKLSRSKIIYFESNCHFYEKSLTGKLMCKISDLFVIQNKELSSVYPAGVYLGRL